MVQGKLFVEVIAAYKENDSLSMVPPPLSKVVLYVTFEVRVSLEKLAELRKWLTGQLWDATRGAQDVKIKLN